MSEDILSRIVEYVQIIVWGASLNSSYSFSWKKVFYFIKKKNKIK